jgi:hypothetical protein
MLIACRALFDLIGKLSKALCLFALLRNTLRKKLELDPQTTRQVLSTQATFHDVIICAGTDDKRRLQRGCSLIQGPAAARV